MCREKKDEQGISKKQFKNKKVYFTHSFQKQTNKRTEKKRKMAEREKAEDVFTNLLDEKQHFFQIHHNRQAKNAKTGDHFSRNRKIRQNKKNKCKTCQKKQTTKFFW